MEEKFEVAVGILWLVSLLVFPTLLIAMIWSDNIELLKKMLWTDLIVFGVLSVIMSALHD